MVAGERRPWQQCVWRNPDTGRYKLELFPGHGFALPVFETVVDVVEVPEVVSRPVTCQATAAVAEEKADADSGGTPVRTVRPSAAAILITPPAPKVDWEDRQARKRKQDREKAQAHAAVNDTRQDTYLQSALYTFASLAKALVSVPVTLTPVPCHKYPECIL